MREYGLMPRVDLVYFDAGGGHRAAAEALQLVIRQQQPWQTRLVNLQELLDPLDMVRKLTGLRVQDVYNLMLKKNWTLGAAQLLPLLHGLIRLRHAEEVRLMESFWGASRPDLVVSLVPNFNRALFESLRRTAPRAPFVTILTDLADYPPHFWIEPQDQYFICGSGRAAVQARALGIRQDSIYQTSGMILHPRFYEPFTSDRSAERQRLGLDAGLPTAVVLFGGQGAEVMKQIARRLDHSKLEFQLILICGRNDKLMSALKNGGGRLRRSVVGYTTEVPYYMYLSDFFIGKPGPGSISEALAMKLPVIVECNARTLPQERFNADWIVEKRLGIVLRSFRAIASAVDEMLRPENLARYRANAVALNNRAVFEIVPLLEEILKKS